MDKEVNIFEQAAGRWKTDERLAFKGNPISTHYCRISTSTDVKVIGRVWPQTDHINTLIAHEIKHHSFPVSSIRLGRIDLRKSAKLTDCISTAALPSNAFIVSNRALDVFLACNLGVHAIYPATIHHKGSSTEYHVVHCINPEEEHLDVSQSKFHVTGIMGNPRFAIDIRNHQDLQAKRKEVSDGKWPGTEMWDSIRLTLGSLRPNVQTPDFFSIQCGGGEPYISMVLANAIKQAALTGFEITEVLDLVDSLPLEP